MTMKLIRNAYGRHAHSHEVLPMLGLKPGGHLPKEGMQPREIQGITVYVTPQEAPVVPINTRYYGLRVPKSSAHRVMAVCPNCAKHLSLGRLHQHMKVHIETSPGVTP